MYPLDVTPAPVAGVEFVKSRVAGRGTYDGTNKPFVDFNAVVAGTDKTRGFVVDDRGFANIILGRGIPPPPASDKGHFHTESSEFWFILLGQIRYSIEGLPTFVADQGDIVYVPKQRWHLASFAGDGPSARLAMNGYPDLAHSFEAEKRRALRSSARRRKPHETNERVMWLPPSGGRETCRWLPSSGGRSNSGSCHPDGRLLCTLDATCGLDAQSPD
jgi:mannose-6-phosphate isomerase-like protein (cupin superfamily)